MKYPVLVYIDLRAGKYCRYVGRVCTDIFEFELPISAEWINEIRTNPAQFGEEANHQTIAPQEGPQGPSAAA